MRDEGTPNDVCPEANRHTGNEVPTRHNEVTTAHNEETTPHNDEL